MSSLWRVILLGTGIFLVGFLVGTTLDLRKETKPPLSYVLVSPGIVPSPTWLLPSYAEEQAFVISRVIDGDTVELSTGERVRYIGIDTPESVDPRKPVQCFAKEATERNKQLVLGKTVILEKDVSQTDRYGRLLRYIYITTEAGDKIFVNETLVREGYAFSSSFPPDVKYQTRFQEAEKEARANNRGLWASCPVNSGSVESSSTTLINSSSDTKIELKQETSTLIS